MTTPDHTPERVAEIARKLTPPMVAAMRNMAAGRHSAHGLRGNSAHGGHNGTIFALLSRGLMSRGELTDLGRAVAALLSQPQEPRE